MTATKKWKLTATKGDEKIEREYLYTPAGFNVQQREARELESQGYIIKLKAEKSRNQAENAESKMSRLRARGYVAADWKTFDG